MMLFFLYFFEKNIFVYYLVIFVLLVDIDILKLILVILGYFL